VYVCVCLFARARIFFPLWSSANDRRDVDGGEDLCGGIEDSNTVGHVRNTINHAVGTQDASTVLVVRGDSGRNVDDGEGP